MAAQLGESPLDESSVPFTLDGSSSSEPSSDDESSEGHKSDDEQKVEEEQQRLRDKYFVADRGSRGQHLIECIDRYTHIGFAADLIGWSSISGRINECPVIRTATKIKDEVFGDELSVDVFHEHHDTVLGKAVHHYFVPGVQLIVANKGTDMTAKSKGGMPAFFKAAIGDSDDIVNVFLGRDERLVRLNVNESVVSAIIRQPSVQSILNNSTFPGGSAQAKKFKTWFEGELDDTSLLELTYFGPATRINSLVSHGALVSTRDRRGASPLDIAKNPSKFLKHLVPIAGKDNFILRTSDIKVTPEGALKFTATVFNKRRNKSRNITITYDFKTKLVPTLTECLSRELSGKAVIDASATLHQAHGEIRSAVRTAEEAKVRSEQAIVIAEQVAVDLSKYKELNDAMMTQIMNGVDTALETAAQSKFMTERLTVKVCNLEVEVQKIGGVALVMYDKLYKPAYEVESDLKSLEMCPNAYRFYRINANEMVNIMQRTRNGKGPSDKIKATTIIAMLGQTLAEHVSMPIITGLVSAASKGIAAWGDYKEKKEAMKILVESAPLKTEDFAINLGRKLARRLQNDLAYPASEKEINNFGTHAMLLAFSSIPKVAAKVKPDSPTFVDALIEDIQSNPDKEYKAFREQLAKLKTRKSPGMTFDYDRAQAVASAASDMAPASAVNAAQEVAKKAAFSFFKKVVSA